MKYLKASKTLAYVAFPSKITSLTQATLFSIELNADVFEASVFAKEIPIFAIFIADYYS